MPAPHLTRTGKAAGLVLALALAGGTLAGCAEDDAAPATTMAPTTAAPADQTTTTTTAQPVGLGHDDFVAAVTDLCLAADEDISAAEAQLEDPVTAADGIEGFGAALEAFVEGVRELDVPAEDAELTDRMLEPLSEIAAAMAEGGERVRSGEELAAVEAELPWHLFSPADQAAVELGVVGGLSSCGQEGEVVAAGATVVEVVATDYAFELPSELEAGPTAFVMANEGDEMHFLLVVKMLDGFTVHDALAAEQAGEDPEAMLDGEWHSLTVGSGQEAVVNVDLVPGEYGVLCFVHAPDGRSHVEHGMVNTFTVS